MEITLEAVQRCLVRHVPMYAWHKPVYQHVVFQQLAQLWEPGLTSALDVGGGTGVMAETARTLFGIERVVSVDIHDRYLHSLTIQTQTYDGTALPFADASFDCILIFNVLHHVPRAARLQVLRECRRVAGDGPIFIKDHIRHGALDGARLAALDLMGNMPFHGMVQARYLGEEEWRELADGIGDAVLAETRGGPYRSGLFGALFPNRLETTMKWRPSSERHG